MPKSFTIFSWVYADFNCSNDIAAVVPPGGIVHDGDSSSLREVVHCEVIGVGKGNFEVSRCIVGVVANPA